MRRLSRSGDCARAQGLVRHEPPGAVDSTGGDGATPVAATVDSRAPRRSSAFTQGLAPRRPPRSPTLPSGGRAELGSAERDRCAIGVFGVLGIRELALRGLALSGLRVRPPRSSPHKSRLEITAFLSNRSLRVRGLDVTQMARPMNRSRPASLSLGLTLFVAACSSSTPSAQPSGPASSGAGTGVQTGGASASGGANASGGPGAGGGSNGGAGAVSTAGGVGASGASAAGNGTGGANGEAGGPPSTAGEHGEVRICTFRA